MTRAGSRYSRVVRPEPMIYLLNPGFAGILMFKEITVPMSAVLKISGLHFSPLYPITAW